MYSVSDCSQGEYHFLRMIGRHRKSLTYSILREIHEEGSIEWEDYAYSSLSEDGELPHPVFSFLRRLLGRDDLRFEDYHKIQPAKKPLTSIWNLIGKTSAGSVVFIGTKTNRALWEDQIGSDATKLTSKQFEGVLLDAERMHAIEYLAAKGITTKYVDLILIDKACEDDSFKDEVSKWKEILDIRNKIIGISGTEFCFSHIYSCCLGLDGNNQQMLEN